jgi:outer membrane protein assembly factor BamA
MKSIVSTIIFFLITSIVFSQENITISSINISGNKITKKEIIIRELLFDINSRTTIIELEDNITESQKNLTNLKLFNFNEIRYSIIDSLVEIDIEVVERWYFWPYPIFEISERKKRTYSIKNKKRL